MASVRLENLSRKAGNTVIIDNISFTVPKGEFWVLVGPSGCGKSTILRTIAGLETATSGNIYIGEALVNHIPARNRDVAMVFQNYALYPHMSVAENLAFGLKMRQTNPIKIKERVETVARSLNIDRLLDRKPKQLSGGQQQRVALGRAIAREPQVFLLDEPLSNLDAQLRDDTRAELKQLHSSLNITTIYVTHDQIEAMTLADQIIVLNRGQIQQIGTPNTIYHHPANRMVATFMGNPPMNILPAIYMGNFMVSGQSLSCPPEFKDKYQPREGQGFDLGIRPEQMRLNDNYTEQNRGDLLLEVQLIEPLGRETLIRGILPDSETILQIISSSNWAGKVGDRLQITLDLAQMFVFDPATGEKLYPQT
ncbi:ABC transporter ATP-binding protein [Merismopedia glauca]|uniref:Sugar ABC transporter ATP-binding protein n=1 Tax=Merismopedia glauca CCAP 1448/3 TaxID=1296344 RepID=A0A2T1C8R9_9CYAN|nr:sn-glycerol-3-phosphate ABC transporter ATP-binding protein UgpC [Merismopedia glauca]PSB04634.1 sugar ABC transporter ATP-binding protein [Merismopedia glauca CCAP 1448/3]